MHNTLAASDYGLLDENTLTPRPNFWAALLWRKLMGSKVLDPHVSAPDNVYAYAHCLRSQPGGVALLAVNADQQHTYQLNVPNNSERYTLTAEHLEDKTVLLNGKPLALLNNGDLPQISGERAHAGKLAMAPRSIIFLAIPNADNSACR